MSLASHGELQMGSPHTTKAALPSLSSAVSTSSWVQAWAWTCGKACLCGTDQLEKQKSSQIWINLMTSIPRQNHTWLQLPLKHMKYSKLNSFSPALSPFVHLDQPVKIVHVSCPDSCSSLFNCTWHLTPNDWKVLHSSWLPYLMLTDLSIFFLLYGNVFW